MEDNSTRKSRRGCKYDKTSLQSRLRLLMRVVTHGEPIKKTAELLNIKYSTAKTIVRQFYDQGRSLNSALAQQPLHLAEPKPMSLLRCSYRQIPQWEQADVPDTGLETMSGKQTGEEARLDKRKTIDIAGFISSSFIPVICRTILVEETSIH